MEFVLCQNVVNDGTVYSSFCFIYISKIEFVLCQNVVNDGTVYSRFCFICKVRWNLSCVKM